MSIPGKIIGWRWKELKNLRHWKKEGIEEM